MYNELTKISDMSVNNWVTNEVFSLGWFVMVGVLAAVYIIWLFLLDKKRAGEMTGLCFIQDGTSQ